MIKQRPEDFVVEEVPLYEPCGEGEHLYVTIEKCRRTTTDVIHRLAKIFHVRQSEIGFAGLKDKHAVARQQLSIRLPDTSQDQALLDQIDPVDMRLISAARHTNKLRRGHLLGNRFEIRIRDVQPDVLENAGRILDRLVETGAPNFIGAQRFGYRGDNDKLGRLLLLAEDQQLVDRMLGQPAKTDFDATRTAREAYDRGDYDAAMQAWPYHLRYEHHMLNLIRQGQSPKQAVAAIAPVQKEFLISGLQSAIFNLILHRRITDGLFDKLVEGDLAWKHDRRAVFAVDQETAELENGPQGRAGLHEVSPSGPMWGSDMSRAAGQVDQWELDALAAYELSVEQVAGKGKHSASGARRPMRMFLKDAQITADTDEHGPYIGVAMQLERGCFATTVLSEIMKTDGASA